MGEIMVVFAGTNTALQGRMRQVVVLLALFIAAFGSACAPDESVDVTDGSGTDQPRKPAPDCVPSTCEALGAACGSVDNGCGELLDCGGCDQGVCGAGGERNQCGFEGDCVPKTCEDLGAECGPIDDGCGSPLDCGDCGGAAGVICSDQNACVVASCGGEGKNECGSCGPLPMEPGAECQCEGAATCTVFGLQCDDGDQVKLDDATDADANHEVEGIAELTIQEWDYDEYRINVEDTTFSVLDPEFTIDHPGGYELNVCVVMDGIDSPIESYCAGNADAISFVEAGVRRGCCINLDGKRQSSSFQLDFPFAPFQDYSASYAIRVRAHRSTAGVAVNSCEPYRIAFSF